MPVFFGLFDIWNRPYKTRSKVLARFRRESVDMAQTKPEIIVTKIESEVKRLAPNVVTRISYEGFSDDGADLYIYAPRKIADMLQTRAKKLLASLLGNDRLTIRIMVDAFENMSDEAKKKYGIPA